MNFKDEEKISFTIEVDTFCYKRMPSFLKNIGATYSRLVSKMFKDLIERNMKAYMDDIMVRTK